VLVYVDSCAFTFSANPRIGTTVPQNPPVAPVGGASDGNMRTLCTGNPDKSSQPRQKQSAPTGSAHPTVG